jgi:hypothetical protein
MGQLEYRTNSRVTSVAQDLQRLYDDISEFQECCARLCGSFATSDPDEVSSDNAATPVVTTLSHWMEERMDKVCQELKYIQRKVNAQPKGNFLSFAEK